MADNTEHGDPAETSGIGRGKHIVKLLELAQSYDRTGDKEKDEQSRRIIISAWNEWVKGERATTPKFRLDMQGFNAAAKEWRTTPLWGGNRRVLRLWGIDFRWADLQGSHFPGVVLCWAKLQGANLRAANFTDTDVRHVEYKKYAGIWPFRSDLMLGKYLGIRGLGSCFGNPSFRRDAQDQDFIDDKFSACMLWREQGWKANYQRFKITENKWLGWSINPIAVCFRAFRWKEAPARLFPRLLFFLWGLSDYGRSILGSLLYIALGVGVFGALYHYILIPQGSVELTGSLARSTDIIDSWYAAAMGAATLGLTDLMAPHGFLGKLAMFGNALCGLMLFGLLIAIMQNKVARRA